MPRTTGVQRRPRDAPEGPDVQPLHTVLLLAVELARHEAIRNDGDDDLVRTLQRLLSIRGGFDLHEGATFAMEDPSGFWESPPGSEHRAHSNLTGLMSMRVKAESWSDGRQRSARILMTNAVSQAPIWLCPRQLR